MDMNTFKTDSRLLFGKWNYDIVKALMSGPKRYSAIKRMLPITGTTLTGRLRMLEAENLVLRHMYPEIPIRVEYALTEKGEAMRPMVEAFERWISQTMDCSDWTKGETDLKGGENMSGVEELNNFPVYFNGDLGTGNTSKRWDAEADRNNEIAFYQSLFSDEPVIRFASEEKIRSAYEALAAGGKIVKPLTEVPVGGLSATVTDRNGIGWNLHYDRG